MSNVMGHLLKLPVDYFERRHLGDIVARFGTVRTIEHTITSATVDSVMDGLLAFSTLAMMFIYSPKLAVVTLCAVVLYGIVRWMRYNSAKLAQTGLLAKTAIEQTYFLETIRGARSIKLNNKENERRTAWMNLLVDSTNAGLTTTKLSLFFTTTWGLISTVERTGVLWLGAQSVIQNTMSIGMLFAFLGYKEQFASRVNALIDRFVDFRMLSVQTERLADIVLTAPEEPPEQSIYDVPENVALSLNRLNYRYAKGDPWLLHSLNLKIEQGECVAIVGPSGSGKTTLMKLMLGILRPVSGEVCIGEPNPVSLNKIGLRSYRKFVATVMQDDQLFAGSLMDNICFLDSKPEVDWMYECAKMAQIHNEIVSMPMGYHTLVGDMGTVLSGGQKQRVLLARALYRRPKILFLDEATSHLDLDNEANITKAIAELRITRIMIAHRPQTIAIADRILTLRNGKIIEIKGDASSNFAATSSNDTREQNTVE
jgi:ATP-binding cassette subfamily B protein RaxB